MHLDTSMEFRGQHLLVRIRCDNVSVHAPLVLPLSKERSLQTFRLEPIEGVKQAEEELQETCVRGRKMKSELVPENPTYAVCSYFKLTRHSRRFSLWLLLDSYRILGLSWLWTSEPIDGHHLITGYRQLLETYGCRSIVPVTTQ